MPRRSRYAQRDQRQAADEARLKFSPQAQALVQVLSDIQGQAKESGRQAYTGGRMVAAAAKQSIPEMKRIFGQAGNRANQVNSVLANDLAKLGPEADSYKLAAKIGTGGATARLAEAGSRATSELVSRKSDALLGSVHERRNIRAGLKNDTQKIYSQLQQNAAQLGDYASVRAGQLANDRADRSVKKSAIRTASTDRARDRNSRERIAAENRASAEQRAAAKVKAPGSTKKWAAPASQASAKDRIAEALSHAKEMQTAGRDRQEIAKILLQGRSPTTLKDAKGNPVPVKGRPKLPELYITAALDMTFGGGLHPATIKKLHDRGIKVKPLGYPRYKGDSRAVQRPAGGYGPGGRGRQGPT